MRTWVKELLLVSAALVVVLAAKGVSVVELIGTAAVILAFCHVQVATRLDEAAEIGERSSCSSAREHGVSCRAWLERYLVAKEILWCAYFVMLGAYSALVGVAAFLLYPLWRKHRKKLKARSIITAALLAVCLATPGCATTFETDRDRVVVFGALVFAAVSNKTTKAQADKSEKEPASENIRAAGEASKSSEEEER